MIELWANIKNYPDYQVSDKGRVKRAIPKGHGKIGLLLPNVAKCKNGYKRIMLYPGRRIFFVHRLVMEAFTGDCLEGKQVNHKNGKKGDNRLSNLEYCTAKENTNHACLLGLRDNKGSKNNFAKLKEADVLKIRQEYDRKNGITCRYLAVKYGVSPSNIQYIIKRTIWKHLN